MIVDDEQSSIDLLKWLIGQYCPDVTEIMAARSVQDAIPLIKTFDPDILFLDIQMPHQSGFDLLNSIDQWRFEVIFTTAYNEFAIQAIRFSALDYLLKPVDEVELQKAVERYSIKIKNHSTEQNKFQNLAQPDKEKFKLALSDSSEVKYVSLDDIIRLQADSNYTHIYLRNSKPFLSAKTLKEYDEILQGYSFLRVHKSHLVNPHHIVSYDKKGLLHLSDHSTIEVSRRKRDYFLSSMGDEAL